MQHPECYCRAHSHSLFEITHRYEFIQQTDSDNAEKTVAADIEPPREEFFHISSSKHPLNDARNVEGAAAG